LPSNLKPVREWLEPDAAVDALATEIAAALDPRTAWPIRRARLTQLVRPGGVTPALAHAAALLLEASGDPSRFLSRPFELLIEWRTNSDGTWPPVPRALKRALGLPLAAGIADNASSEERRSLEVSALTRAVESGAYPPQLADKGTPARLRFRAAAGRRAQGGGDICEWLPVDGLPAGLRTGCRDAAESGGFVYARPARGESFEVIARSAAGAEAVLLVWPRWLLFPLILPDREELTFVDGEGIWSVALDASRAPRQVASGSYRHLAAAPDGRSLAAALWPEGKVVVITDAGVRTLDLDGRGGIAWLAPDVLLASDGAALRLGAASGGTRETSLVLPSTHSLTVRKGAVLVAAGKNGDCAVQQIFIAENRAERRVGLVSPSLGLLTLEDGTVVGGSATLWSWREGRAVEQVGAGLTPGPGS
jgi:hypothetical protein